MKTFKFEFVKLSLIWRCTNGPRREKDKFDLNFPAGRPQGKINQIIFLLFIAAGSGDWSILELSNRAAAGERTMKSFLLFLELVGYGAGTAQWLRQEEKTKKKWLNEWVSPQRQSVKWSQPTPSGSQLSEMKLMERQLVDGMERCGREAKPASRMASAANNFFSLNLIHESNGEKSWLRSKVLLSFFNVLLSSFSLILLWPAARQQKKSNEKIS